MASIDGLTWCAVAAELSAKLIGSRVDKVFQPHSHTIVLSLRQPGHSYFLSLCGLPNSAAVLLLDERPETPSQAPAFCMLLRKHLEGARLLNISQPGFDRLLIFNFAAREEGGQLTEKELVLEVAGRHSNLIFLRNGLIADAVRRVGPEDSRLRQILPNLPYETPPLEGKLNLATLKQELFEQRFLLQTNQGAPPTASLMATLAGVGPFTAEACLAAAAELGTNDPLVHRIWQVLANWQKQLQNPDFWHAHAVLRPNGKVQALLPFLPATLPDGSTSLACVSLLDALAWLHRHEAQQQLPQQQELQRVVQTELTKLSRKKHILEEECQDASLADHWRLYGDLLMAQLHLVAKGTSEAMLPNLFEPDTPIVKIPLDPARTPAENAQHCYRQYNKSKRRQIVLAEQIQQTTDTLSYLDSVQTMLHTAATTVEIQEIRQELVNTGFLAAPKKKQAALPLSQPLQVQGPEQSLIWVGRNNRQNDELTFRRGKPGDLWFHAKDMPGSHVLLQMPPGQTASKEAIELAASLAAHFSKGSASSRVAVDYTDRKQVKKPSGSKPGFVIYFQQTTLYVSPDPERLKPYLDNKKMKTK
ncbi:Rqc2 family fibronectin-binding protein [Anaeromusa acidaminophila]|uniref:Rqc2 family fibronectin-binding protein n=1 Tax=Anaeromusa acidaminophila TaxID=81464 RepID=UPI000376EF4E|nr:NFACT RNA binding domain-containing protein [Anaeromusa acidaminophila]